MTIMTIIWSRHSAPILWVHYCSCFAWCQQYHHHYYPLSSSCHIMTTCLHSLLFLVFDQHTVQYTTYYYFSKGTKDIPTHSIVGSEHYCTEHYVTYYATIGLRILYRRHVEYNSFLYKILLIFCTKVYFLCV